MPKRILIADNQQESSLILKKAFNELKLTGEVDFVQNGFQVLSYLDALTGNDPLPTLIVLDANMQSLISLDTLKRIRENRRFKNIPVIIYTSTSTKEEKEKFAQSGVVEYLVNPADLNQCVPVAKSLYEIALSKL
jgi:CheY-like chemotaxis protein